MLHPRGVPRCRRVLLLVLRQAPVPGLVPKAAARVLPPAIPRLALLSDPRPLSRCFFLHRFRSPVRYRIPGPASGRSFVRVCRGSRCRCIPLRHRPVPDREKRIFAARLVEDRTQPCGVAVGDQDLPERIFGHEADQLLHASLSKRSSSSRIGRSPLASATMVYCASLRAMRNDFCCPCDPYLRRG